MLPAAAAMGASPRRRTRLLHNLSVRPLPNICFRSILLTRALVCRYTSLFQPPAAAADSDKVVAGLVRARLLSECVAFVSGDKLSVLLVFSVAAAATGTSLVSCLISEACSAVLAAQSAPAPPAATSNLTITSSAPLQPGAYVVIAKSAGDHQVHAALHAGAAVDADSQVLCQGTLSCTW
jgi:hypothetical protein